MKKILVIEDNTNIRENIAEILELANYEVVTAENGKVGVAAAKSEGPDLILCDIMMPELDGYGVIKILSRNPETASIPFIFLTAKSEKGDFRKGMNLGADDYITKPFEEDELLDVIETRLKKSAAIHKDHGSGVEGLKSLIQESRGLSELSDLSNDRKEKKYSKKEEIYREGDYSNYMYLIISGKVKCVKTDTYGKDLVTEIMEAGDYLGYMGLLATEEYHESAVALEDTVVSIIPKQDFLDLIQKNRDVATKFINMLSGNVREKEARLLQLAYAPARERVADILVRLNDSEMDGELKISRDDLASMVGTATESLIRMLSEFKKEELIDIERTKIKILDADSLKKIANGF